MTAVMTRVLLALRVHRFELVAVTLLAVAVLAGSGGLLLRLLAFHLPVSCFTGGPVIDPTCAARQIDVNAYMAIAGNFGVPALGGVVLLPILSGLILGVALVGKELDRGTAALAWSVAPSRRAWLLDRVLPVALLIIAASLAAGLIADGLQVARDPGTDPERTFAHLGLRGVVVAAEGLFVFGVALAVGARLGRVLPALILSGVFAFAGYAGTTLLMDGFLHTETVTVNASSLPPAGLTAWGIGKVLDSRVRTPDGRVLTWEAAYNEYGDVGPGMPGYTGGFDDIYIVNPGALYPIVEWRMTVIYGALGLAGIVLAFAIVERRRPV